ncbi:MAG: COG1361 S-layer family protein, partial [Nitrosopumilus sp.]
AAVIEIANDGSAPISGVDIIATNTQTELSSTSSSTTNIENVVILESSWNIGNIDPNSVKHFTATVYVPEGLKGDTLRIPLSISYYNSQGDQNTISKIVDFYVKGLIDLSIFNVDVIELSGTQMVIGEIINEGNDDGLFGFVKMESRGDSNIKPTTQFIDEIEIDAPVPFNLPIEFDGEPKYGKHDITITVRYKDSIRDEIFLTHDTTIFVNELSNNEEDNSSLTMVIIPIIAAIGVGAYIMYKRKKSTITTS